MVQRHIQIPFQIAIYHRNLSVQIVHSQQGILKLTYSSDLLGLDIKHIAFWLSTAKSMKVVV